MNKFAILLCLLIAPLISRAQIDFRYNSYNFNGLPEYISNIDLQFELLNQSTNQAFIYCEGGVYSNYANWSDKWRSRKSNNLQFNFNEFSNSQISAIAALSNGVVPSVSEGPWIEAGPSNIPEFKIEPSLAGGDYGIGPIEYITFDPNNADRMLAASTAGGLFFSNNAGLSWINAGSDSWLMSNCGWAAISPVSSDTWYALNSGSGSTGPEELIVGGLYRTVNSGQSWDLVVDQDDFSPDIVIQKAALNMTNTNQLVICSNRGFHVIHNLNATEVNLTHVENPIAGHNESDIHDVIYIPGTSETFVASIRLHQQSGNSLILSSDGGLDWDVVIDFPQDLNLTPNITLHHSLDDLNAIYVFGSDHNNSTTSFQPITVLYRYDLQSGTWLSIPIPDNQIAFGGGRGFAISQINSQNMAYSYGTSDIRTTTNSWVSFIDYSGDSDLSTGVNDINFHDDIEQVIFHPGETEKLWLATHGGISMSSTFGDTWERRSSGLSVAQVFSLSVSSKKDYNRLLIGLYHDGRLYRNEFEDWYLVGGCDGGQTLMNQTNPAIMYSSGQDNCSGPWEVTSDSYETKSDVLISNGAWRNRGALNSLNSNIFYANEGNQVSRCINGINCESISSFPASTNEVPRGPWKLFSSPTNSDHLYYHQLRDTDPLGPDPATGNLHRDFVCDLWFNPFALELNSTVVQGLWVQLHTPSDYPPANPLRDNKDWLAGMAFDELNDKIVYLSYKSIDYPGNGQGTGMVYRADYSNIEAPIFTDITFNLPSAVVGDWHDNTILCERGSDGGLYLATNLGVFYTNNKFLNTDQSPWKLFGSRLPHVGIYDLEIDYTNNIIYSGTLGRGVWSHTLYCPPDEDMFLTGSLMSDEYYEVTSTITSCQTIIDNTVNYRAGQEIVLTDGFVASAANGGSWRAFIHGCDTPGSSFRMGQEENSDFLEERAFANKDALSTSPALFPNPTNGLITYTATAPLANATVMDLTGRALYSQPCNGSNSISIDLSPYRPGTYLLRVQYQSGKVEVHRVVRQ